MKNLLIYVNPAKKFDRESTTLIKIQIDNSLDLGWKKEDILLATNFDYEYKGVKALIVDDSNYHLPRPTSIKTIVVAYLFEHGVIENNELYWIHDLDAYQLNLMTKDELNLGLKDIGLTTYGWSPKWCLGSYFFKKSAEDIFKLAKNTLYKMFNDWHLKNPDENPHKHKGGDERALAVLTKSNTNNINRRIKKLNITYNIGMRKIGYNYRMATKPLKVLHFHPSRKGRNVLDAFMYGKNEIKIPLMTKRLIKIFQSHGIR